MVIDRRKPFSELNLHSFQGQTDTDQAFFGTSCNLSGSRFKHTQQKDSNHFVDQTNRAENFMQTVDIHFINSEPERLQSAYKLSSESSKIQRQWRTVIILISFIRQNIHNTFNNKIVIIKIRLSRFFLYY